MCSSNGASSSAFALTSGCGERRRKDTPVGRTKPKVEKMARREANATRQGSPRVVHSPSAISEHKSPAFIASHRLRPPHSSEFVTHIAVGCSTAGDDNQSNN